MSKDSMIDMDDDFQMKPLTAGIGFHKKSVSLKEHIAKSGLSQDNMKRSLPPKPPEELMGSTANRSSQRIISELQDALKSAPAERTKVRLTDTLPRDISELPKHEREIDSNKNRNTFENIKFQIPETAISEGKGTQRSAHDGLIRPLVPVSVSFAAIFLDSLVVMAATLLFLVALIMVTGIDLVSVVNSGRTEFTAQLSLIVLYLAVYEMFVVVSRTFFGMSLGEWTFDLQMGDDEQIKKPFYPALILWRSFVNLFTGLLLLPIASFILQKDLAAKLTGLQLYRKNI